MLTPDAGESARFTGSFLRLIIFHIGQRPAARPQRGYSLNGTYAKRYLKHNALEQKTVDQSANESYHRS